MIAPSLALGFAAGLRTMTPAAVLALRRGRPLVGGALFVLAAGEMVVDKLPRVPARTEVAPALARIVMGSFVGALVAPRGVPRAAGAALGVLGAIAGTHIGFAARRSASKIAPDFAVALIEDLAAVTVAAWAARPRAQRYAAERHAN